MNTYDTKMSVWGPRNEVMLQTGVPEVKPPTPNMGRSSDKALTEGRIVADEVVAKQEAFMANHNSTHA